MARLPEGETDGSPLQRACSLVGHAFRRGSGHGTIPFCLPFPQPVSTGLLACRPRLQAWFRPRHHPILSSVPQPVSTGLLACRPRLQAWFTPRHHPILSSVPQPASAGLLACRPRLQAWFSRRHHPILSSVPQPVSTGFLCWSALRRWDVQAPQRGDHTFNPFFRRNKAASAASRQVGAILF